MVGADVARVLADEPASHRYLLPDVCLSDDGRFLDGMTVADLPRPVEVVVHRRLGVAPCAHRGGCHAATIWSSPVSDPVAGSVPTVAIIGRPNVGKSTLVNRIVGEQATIVEDRPGVTRDRKVLDAEWLGVPFRVVDTGGWMPGGSDLDTQVSRQVEAAVAGSRVVLFVVDAAVGVTDDDEAIARWLRRGGHDVIVVANKSDNDRREDGTLGVHGARAGRALPRERAARTPRRRSARRGGRPLRSARTSSGRRALRRRGGQGARCAPRCDRRATERRQVDAVQPLGRRGPSRGARPRRHDP